MKGDKEYIVFIRNNFVGYTKQEMTKEEILKYMEIYETAELEVFKKTDKIKLKKTFELEV